MTKVKNLQQNKNVKIKNAIPKKLQIKQKLSSAKKIKNFKQMICEHFSKLYVEK